MPPMNSSGMNTAARDSVIDRIVKPISAEPSSAAWSRPLPVSMCLTMFSSTTMASSTTNPTHSVNAIRESVSRLYPRRNITGNVPTTESGNAREGMTVAETFRRKKKMTRITRTMLMNSVN